jgi:hypothetical protein
MFALDADESVSVSDADVVRLRRQARLFEQGFVVARLGAVASADTDVDLGDALSRALFDRRVVRRQCVASAAVLRDERLSFGGSLARRPRGFDRFGDWLEIG